MSVTIVGPEVEPRLDWIALTEALEAGHELPRAEVNDALLYRGRDTMLTRAAWIDGLGLAVKVATIFPGNSAKGLPALDGMVNLLSDADGLPEALLEFKLVTKWKTAGDSLLAARHLARPDARRILIVGAGTVARSMVAAYSAAFPGAEFTVWNRSPEGAQAFAAETGATVADDLETAVRGAEIIATATMTTEPVLRGDWLQPGTHLDLIGAYTPAMREVDDACLQRARLFVDARSTTLHHIGELKIPLESGAIAEDDVIADFYDLPGGTFRRESDEEITICKNGGGAHLDLMTARYILGAAG